jgi:DNA-binding MarR family transcriptional regulator
MASLPELSAREILETVPAVMRFIRDQVRGRRAAALSLPQFRTLVFLSRVKNSSLSAVAGHLGLSLPAMSRLVNGLVAGRLVGRQTVSTNRRQIALTLTAQGRATLEKARGEIRLQLAEAVKNLSMIEQKSILRAMGILQKVFDKRAVSGGSLAKVET